METLELIPRGDVQKSYAYGTKQVEFENGITQYQRKWITPRLTLTFSVTGNKDMKDYLEDFVIARHGNYEPFYWEYEGTKDVYRFGDSTIQFTEIRGYGGTGVVGYKADITLVRCKEGEY